MSIKERGEITMNVWRTNQYSFNDEEKSILSKAKILFEALSDNLLYSADDYYELDTLNLTQCDLELIRNALTALVNASSIVTHDNVMTAD